MQILFWVWVFVFSSFVCCVCVCVWECGDDIEMMMVVFFFLFLSLIVLFVYYIYIWVFHLYSYQHDYEHTCFCFKFIKKENSQWFVVFFLSFSFRICIDFESIIILTLSSFSFFCSFQKKKKLTSNIGNTDVRNGRLKKWLLTSSIHEISWNQIKYLFERNFNFFKWMCAFAPHFRFLFFSFFIHPLL